MPKAVVYGCVSRELGCPNRTQITKRRVSYDAAKHSRPLCPTCGKPMGIDDMYDIKGALSAKEEGEEEAVAPSDPERRTA